MRDNGFNARDSEGEGEEDQEDEERECLCYAFQSETHNSVFLRIFTRLLHTSVNSLEISYKVNNNNNNNHPNNHYYARDHPN